jgi:hypothetical protein
LDWLSDRASKVYLSYLPAGKIYQTELMRIIGQHQFFLSVSPAEGLDIPPLEATFMGTVVVGFDGFIGSVINDTNVGQRLYDASRIAAQQPECYYPGVRNAWDREMTVFMSTAKSQRITDI